MTRIQTSLVIDEALYKRVRKFAIDKESTKTQIIEQALKDYMKSNK